MHPCFTIPELFIIITETIYADERKGQSSVAALARTCKLFLEPALDVLWRYQITLVPLLRCLPDGVMIVKDYGPHWYRDYSSKISFKRALIPSDWKRVDYYAPRIQALGRYRPRCLQSISKDAMEQIALRGRPLMPNLKQIVWRDNCGDLLPSVQYLLHQDITTVFIGQGHYSDKELVSFVDALAARTPNLRQLILEANHGLDYTMYELPSSLAKLTHLRSITCQGCAISTDTYHSLTPLQHVEELTLSLAGEAHMDFTQGGLFPVLQRASVVVDNLAVLERVGLLAESSTVNHLYIRPRLVSSARHISDYFSMVASSPSRHSIKHMETDSYDEVHNPLPQFAITSQVVAHLLVLSNLTSLIIRLPCWFDLDDALLLDMASSWPRLTNMWMVCPHSAPIGVTFVGLQYLAFGCANLENLGVGFDPSIDEHQALDPPTSRLSQSRVRVINVGASPIHEATRKVASRLGTLFPALEEVESNWPNLVAPDWWKFGPRWAEVNKCLAVGAYRSDAGGALLY